MTIDTNPHLDNARDTAALYAVPLIADISSDDIDKAEELAALVLQTIRMLDRHDEQNVLDITGAVISILDGERTQIMADLARTEAAS